MTETSVSTNTNLVTVTTPATTIATTAGFVPIKTTFSGPGDTNDAPAGKRTAIDRAL